MFNGKDLVRHSSSYSTSQCSSDKFANGAHTAPVAHHLSRTPVTSTPSLYPSRTTTTPRRATPQLDLRGDLDVGARHISPAEQLTIHFPPLFALKNKNEPRIDVLADEFSRAMRKASPERVAFIMDLGEIPQGPDSDVMRKI